MPASAPVERPPPLSELEVPVAAGEEDLLVPLLVLVEVVPVIDALLDEACVATTSYAVSELTQVALVRTLLGRILKRPIPLSQQLLEWSQQ